MTIKDFDMIEVIKDVPDKGIKAGMRGAVIDVYYKPQLAYEVEFGDESDAHVIEVTLLPEQIKKIDISRAEYLKQGGSRLYLMSENKRQA